ncbi:MAG: hypothetical protein V4733_12735 [Verrucomicrobiota bacterium]
MITGAEFLRVAGVAGLLTGGLAMLQRLAPRMNASAELTRKIVHVVMGVVCMAFPWIFDRPEPVWWLAVLASLPLILLRVSGRGKDGMGSVLHGVARPSYGDVLFAPAVAFVFHLSQGDALFYVVSVSVLALADAAGALAGSRWGRHRYQSGIGWKSVEGSTAFAVSAFLCSALPLACTGRVGWPEAIFIGTAIALLAMMAEGIADRGFDNLILPPVVLLILIRLVPLPLPDLVWRAISAFALLAIAITLAPRTFLNGGALLGAALLGYGCGALADARFVFPLLAVFLWHAAASRKYRAGDVPVYRIDAIISHAISAMPWVLCVTFAKLPAETALLGLSIASAAHLALTQASLYGSPPVVASLTGWLVAASPGLLWLIPLSAAVVKACACGFAATLLLAIIFPRTPHPKIATPMWWTLKGMLALAASIFAWWS